MLRRASLIALASLTKIHKVRGSYADPFQPTWSSLETFSTPEWFRNAKFGMWAHWGPQCQPEAGDWYARGMYQEGNRQYKLHLEKYGHPSVSGFKEVIHSWKAGNWDPVELVNLYKGAGARYFMALANHHDNFDLFDSRYHLWNSVRMGPKKDLIGGWSKAARQAGLRFAVSVHASHAWNWYEVSQRHDLQGSYKGVPYDGMLQKGDGKGKWWDGEDPQELYAQNHPLSKDSYDNEAVGRQWEWGGGAYPPSAAYAEQLHKRIVQLIDSYSPDLVYFDDSKLPLWPVSDVGLRIAAHLYNKSIRDKGRLDAVVTGKILDPNQRKAMVWDIERGQSNAIEPLPWQTDTCIGDWHYDRAIYERKGYKTGKTVIHTLVDVVSKNGNLMLNIPVRGDGTIDEQERVIVEEIGRWMKVNSEGIYDTRPWVVFGEGPAIEGAALQGPGFNEGKGKPFTEKDMRFTTKGGALYVFLMEWPADGVVKVKSLGTASGHRRLPVNKVTLLRNGEILKFEAEQDALVVHLPANGGGYAETLRVE
jgi:alpha-L-fucosidase